MGKKAFERIETSTKTPTITTNDKRLHALSAPGKKDNKGFLVSITQFTSIMKTLSRTLDLMVKIKLLLTILWSCEQNVKESSRHFNPGDRCIWQGF